MAIAFGLFAAGGVAMVLWRMLARRRREAAAAGTGLDHRRRPRWARRGRPPPGRCWNSTISLYAWRPWSWRRSARRRRLPPEEQWPQVCEPLCRAWIGSSRPNGPWCVAGRANSASAASPAPCSPTPACPARAARKHPGRRSPASSRSRGQPLMAGLILRAQSPNSVGQTIIEHETQWLGCLRVKVGWALGLGPSERVTGEGRAS